MAIMLGMLGVFFLGIIVVLYVTLKKSSSFDDYAVGGRSFGPWLVAMSYVNSWWPGTVFISFAGLSVASGGFGFSGLAYSTLGRGAVYFRATRAWQCATAAAQTRRTAASWARRRIFFRK